MTRRRSSAGPAVRTIGCVPLPTEQAVRAALATVNDPEIHQPITELDMVESVTVAADGAVAVRVLLTVAGCPMKERAHPRRHRGGVRGRRA